MNVFYREFGETKEYFIHHTLIVTSQCPWMDPASTYSPPLVISCAIVTHLALGLRVRW
jgi:hypothetical protein